MSVRNCTWIFGLFAFLIFPSRVSAEDATYKLCYRFQAGQFTHVEVDDKAEMMTQNAGTRDKEGRPLESRSVQQTQMLKSYRVVLVDEEGVATLEPIVEKVRMSSQSGDKPLVTFDSSKDETPPLEFEKIAGTIGRALARFHVASNGKLLKVTMLVNDVPKSFSEAAAKADPTINFLVVLPEKPIKIGEKWSEKYDVPVSVGSGLSRPVHMIRTYELTKVANDVASIRFLTSILTPMDDPEILRQMLQQTPKGTVEFDLKQGKILSRSIHIDDKVVGAFGPQTLIQARGESIEKLVIPNSAPRTSNAVPNQQPK